MSKPSFMKSALKNRTMADLARSLGVTRQAVRAWATGIAKVRPELCPKFEEVTGVPREKIRPDIFAKRAQ